MDVITAKLKEVLMSVLPIVAIVLLLHFSLVPLTGDDLARFLIGAGLIILGLTLFLFGVDAGITPIGVRLGGTLARSNQLFILVLVGLVLGFFISIAEPDLHILADQVDLVSGGSLSREVILIAVSLGIALMLTAGLIRIVYNYPLYKFLTIIYGCILLLALLTPSQLLAISFDASGATTGALTVPFILGLGLGVSRMKRDSKASEKDSFGLVGIASTGAIAGVMIMSLIFPVAKISGELELTAVSGPVFRIFLDKLPVIAREIAIALTPILILFLAFQVISFRLPLAAVRKILFGLVFTLVGLILFLLGVNGGFMEVGRIIGRELAGLDHPGYILGVAFLLGMVTILAEPAVSVLTHQIEEVTSGYVRRSIVMVTLSLGVALAVALAILRILVPAIQLWHYLLPGYVLAISLSYFSPKLFVGIGFDSGGVASGPMTATFILAFAQGAAQRVPTADVLVDGFGLIAMVAMTPIIALQILGILFRINSKKEAVESV